MSMSVQGATAKPGVAIMRHDVRAGVEGRELYRASLPPDQRGGGYIPLVHMPWKGFETGTFVAPLADGRIALADTSAWNVKLLGASGKVSAVLRRGIEPLPVTRRLIAQEKERRTKQWTDPGNRSAARMGGGSGTPPPARRPSAASLATLNDFLDEMVFPDAVPVIARMLADPEGRLWVQRTGSDP
jgi:hypothetical protein